MKIDNRRLLLPIMMTLLVLLSCDRVTHPVGYQISQYLDIPSEKEDSREAPEIKVKTTPTQKITDTSGCDATRYIELSIKKTRDTVNEFKTELFEFTIHIRNSHPNASIYLVGFEHHTDVWQNLNETEWVRMGILKPGAVDERDVYHNISHEEEMEGPTYYLIER